MAARKFSWPRRYAKIPCAAPVGIYQGKAPTFHKLGQNPNTSDMHRTLIQFGSLVGVIITFASYSYAASVSITKQLDLDLHDIVQNINYSQAVRSIFDPISTPKWVISLLRSNYSALYEDGFEVNVEDRIYEFYLACPRQECGRRDLLVVFVPKTGKAWAHSADSLNGLLTEIWYGNPDEIAKTDMRSYCFAYEQFC